MLYFKFVQSSLSTFCSQECPPCSSDPLFQNVPQHTFCFG
uniref:Uncharacterized protein n=1 Tax=Anguilla anguilla TaxID=7936 RepID=A0A0E9RDY9_ANGAN